MLPLPKAQKPVPIAEDAAVSEGHYSPSCTPSLLLSLGTSEGDWRRSVGCVKLSLLGCTEHRACSLVIRDCGRGPLLFVRAQKAQVALDSMLGAVRHQMPLYAYAVAQFSALSLEGAFFS